VLLRFANPNRKSAASILRGVFCETETTPRRQRRHRTHTRSSMSASTPEFLTQAELKKLVGYKAVDDYVRSGMVVGLGTGSTAYYAVERVGHLLANGTLTDIICIPTSEATRTQAMSLNIPLCTLNDRGHLDVTIDGADDVDPALNLVKGGGGALLREKMVEGCSEKFICIVDESKLSSRIGRSALQKKAIFLQSA